MYIYKQKNLINEKINDLNLEKSNCTSNQENNAYEKAGAIRANLITEKINDLNREKDNCTSNPEKIPNWPFKCKYCFANFKCQQDLLNHLMIRHVRKNSFYVLAAFVTNIFLIQAYWQNIK